MDLDKFLNKESEGYLEQRWEVVMRDIDSDEEITKYFSSMEIFQGLRQLHKQGAGKTQAMASAFHPSLQDAMMSEGEKAIFANPIHSRPHPPSEFKLVPGGTPPAIVEQFVQMVTDSANMKVVSIRAA